MSSKFTIRRPKYRLTNKKLHLPSINTREKYISTPNSKSSLRLSPNKRSHNESERSTLQSTCTNCREGATLTSQKSKFVNKIKLLSFSKPPLCCSKAAQEHKRNSPDMKLNSVFDQNGNINKSKLMEKMSMSKILSRNCMLSQVRIGKRFGMLQSSGIMFNTSQTIRMQFG